MKKTLLLLFVLCSLFTKAQLPSFPYSGNSSTGWGQNSVIGSKIGFQYAYSFLDTTAANAYQVPGSIVGFLKNMAGVAIRCVNDIYIRSNDLQYWIKQASGSSIGTVTSISQGWGITNTPNPIVSTGTIKADSSTFKDVFWARRGNSGTNPLYDFAGTTDNQKYVIRTNNTKAFTIGASGQVGLGSGEDYGTAKYLFQTNGNSSAPTWRPDFINASNVPNYYQYSGTGNVYFFGNSIVYGALTTSRFSDIISNLMGWTQFNYGVSSRTVENQTPGLGGGSLTANLADIPTKGANDKLLVFLCDLNDMGCNYPNYTVTNFKAAWDTVITNCLAKSWLPKEILLMASGYVTQTGLNYYGTISGTAPTFARLDSFLQASKDVSTTYNILFLDEYHSMKNNGDSTMLNADGVHPLAYGDTIMANSMYNYLNGQVYDNGGVIQGAITSLTGSTGYMPVFTSPTTIGNSAMTYSGGTTAIGSGLSVSSFNIAGATFADASVAIGFNNSYNYQIGRNPTTGYCDFIANNASGITYKGYTFDSKVGIGTGSPTANFHSVGTVKYDLGSDATGDIFYRNSSGLFTRLPIGTAAQHLVGGTIPRWGDTAAATTSLPISSLTSATATNSINNASYLQSWNWNTLTGNALELKTNSTTASSNQSMLYINMLGANAFSGQSTYGLQSINAHSGTTSINYGVYGAASTATTNIGGYFSASGGSNNYSLRLTDGTEGVGKILTSDVNGNANWSALSAAGIVSGSGTQNYLPKWNNAGGTALGNSQLFDNGTNVGINNSSAGYKLDVLGSATSGVSIVGKFTGGTSASAGGLLLGAYNGTYGGIWNNGITPTTSNYTLISDGSNTYVGGSSINIAPGGSAVYSANAGINTFSSKVVVSAAGAASTSPLYLTGDPYTAGTATTNFPLLYLNGGTGPTTFSTAGTYEGINAKSGFTGNFVDYHVNGGASVFNVSNKGDISITNITDDVGINWGNAGTRFRIEQNSYTLKHYTYNASGSYNWSGGSGAHDGRNTNSIFNFNNTFSPTSGTVVNSMMALYPTVNQTGGANGITRGIYINPTITAAADFRALEVSNGNVIFGSTSGNVGIGTTSPAATALLDITSTTKGLLIPRMTNVQVAAISSPATGLKVYSTDALMTLDYNGSAYKSAGVVAGSISTVLTAATTITVTFGGTQPNATYKVNITPTGSILSVGGYVNNKTTTTFDYVLPITTGTVTFDYTLTQ